jgi:toxin-antitoxin system PIN domain toxin
VRYLLDVNFLLACVWRSHTQHSKASAWLDRQAGFVTCPLAQLGFLRVSLSPGYRAAPGDASAALGDLTSRKGSRFIADDLRVDRIPAVSSHADVTDAYLVALAKIHGLRLATLDEVLCAKPWARGVAENPLARERGLPRISSA